MLDAANMRLMGGGNDHGRANGPVEPQLTALATLQRQGLIRHIGLSNATPSQVEQARSIVEIVCVQNQYNLAHRDDDAMIDNAEISTPEPNAAVAAMAFCGIATNQPIAARISKAKPLSKPHRPA